jgi:hypothetical protein
MVWGNPSFAWFINHGKSWFENCRPHKKIMVYIEFHIFSWNGNHEKLW